MYQFIKRISDLLAALLILLLSLPLLVLSALFLYVSNKETPFFFQSRPGKKAVVFNLIKLKTMNDKKDSHGMLLSDADRLTKIGKFIRKTSIDELPQLINVIKGDMSIVGPRPLLVEYLPFYNDIQKRRHEVKPGITGWAQVNGRNSISWERKFEYDVWYVDNQSFLLDMKVLFLTIEKVLRSKDISQVGSVTMEVFNGTK